MRKFIVLIVIPITLFGCAINPNSYKNKKELVEIRPLSREHGLVGIVLANEETVVVPKDVEWIFTRSNTVINDKNKKYVKVYNANYCRDDFYYKDKNSNEIKLANPIFEIRRYYNSSELASNICLAFELSRDNTLLRMKPLKLKIDKTKIRLRKLDNDLDIKINIDIKGFWMDEEKGIRSKKVVDVNINLKNIVLGKEYKLNKIGSDEYISYDNKKSINKNIKTEWFAPIPISIDKNNNYLTNSFGNYSITIEVMEIDNFGKKFEQLDNSLKTITKIIAN